MIVLMPFECVLGHQPLLCLWELAAIEIHRMDTCFILFIGQAVCRFWVQVDWCRGELLMYQLDVRLRLST